MLSMPVMADVTVSDPKGDDNGHGAVVYPTGKEYKRGSFDLTGLKIQESGSDVIITATFASKVLDPWKSKEWGGNGFSLQFVQLYINSDPSGGHEKTLPGINGVFGKEDAWDKVVLLSPQGRSRLKSEVNTKATSVKADVIIPRTTKARGKTIRAVVSKEDLGPTPMAQWGIQALVQSNEGYPAPEDLLTRKVNEMQGEHRFGGGNDWECDAHVIDMIAGKGTGDATEVASQHAALKDFCGPDGMRDKSEGKRSVLPMVYPGKQ